jgi:hypothetical protein
MSGIRAVVTSACCHESCLCGSGAVLETGDRARYSIRSPMHTTRYAQRVKLDSDADYLRSRFFSGMFDIFNAVLGGTTDLRSPLNHRLNTFSFFHAALRSGHSIVVVVLVIVVLISACFAMRCGPPKHRKSEPKK